MIKLSRKAPPESVLDKLAKARAKASELSTSGMKVPKGLAGSYKVAKPHVAAESHDKCMYCESKIGHVCFGDVEHIVAKALAPELTYSYENLGLACSVCNNNKSDYHDPSRPLVNPYIDSPDDHFIAAGPMIKHRAGHERACITEKILGLNRPSLIEKRIDRINRLHHLVYIYATVEGAMKETIKIELLQEAGSDKEYAFIVRAYIKLAAGL